MNFNSLVSVRGFNFPDPAPSDGYKVNFATIVDSGRNLQGYVTGAVIRDDVIKITLKWNYISQANLMRILQLFSPAYGGSFYNDVTFFNPMSNGWETREMYVSDRPVDMWLRNHLTGDCRGYNNISFSLIER